METHTIIQWTNMVYQNPFPMAFYIPDSVFQNNPNILQQQFTEADYLQWIQNNIPLQ